MQGTADFVPVHVFARYDFSGQKKGAFLVRGPKDYLYVSLDPAREYLWVAPYQTGTHLRIFEALTGREFLPGGKSASPEG
jgi:hypothetical protein